MSDYNLLPGDAGQLGVCFQGIPVLLYDVTNRRVLGIVCEQAEQIAFCLCACGACGVQEGLLGKHVGFSQGLGQKSFRVSPHCEVVEQLLSVAQEICWFGADSFDTE